MDTTSELIGCSTAARDIGEEIVLASRTDAKVLVTGESGVGKDVVARLIHQRSQRSRRPLVTINCAGVPDSLLESELFGHVRGSFTGAYRDKRGWFAQAHTGTVFMDEIGDMSLRMQALLLRFLDNGEIQPVGSDRVGSTVDVRIIAATNRNLVERVAEKNFREDLFYRLNVIHVAIPSLRERREDIPLLLDHFFAAYAKQHRAESPRLLEETMARLVCYDWPGNVRELKNVAERLVIRKGGQVIVPEDLPQGIARKGSGPAPVADIAPGRLTPDVLFERMSVGGESFWTLVYEPFMARDLTRHDLRAIVSLGLEHTKGSYKLLLRCFNLQPNDYKRFLSFLRKHECHLPFQRFRSLTARLTIDDQHVQRQGVGRGELFS